MAKLEYHGTDNRPKITIRVLDGEHFYSMLKSLGYPNGGKRTVERNYEQLLSGKRKSAYGWRLANG